MYNKEPDCCDILHFQPAAPYFQALYNAPAPILVAQEDGRLLLINRTLQAVTGCSPKKTPTFSTWTACLNGSQSESIQKRFSGLFRSDGPLEPFRVSIKSTDGKRLTWQFFNAPLGRTSDGQRMVICIASDVTEKLDQERHLQSVMNQLEQDVSKRTADLNATIRVLENQIAERKRMSDALALSRERIKQMSRRTLNVLEADRRTVSKELHDSIGASLAAIKFSLEDKEMKRARNKNCLDESLNQEIAHLLAAIKETKRISANLRPTTLDDLGLMATIKWYLRQFQRLYGHIRIHYTTDIIESDVPEIMKIIIYRIVQEGLNNAEKHSEASSVRLHMEFTDGKRSISLFIEDDGRGFDVEAVLSEKDPLSGYGLIAMRERCEIFGGSFHIESHPGQGTRINAILPV